MTSIALLQPVSEYLGTHDGHRLLAKVVVIALGTLLVLLLGSIMLRRAADSRTGALLLLFLAANEAGVVFAALLFAVRALSFHFPALRPNAGLWGVADVLRIGFVMGLTNFALWTLALVLPRWVADSRLRAVELASLRSQAELAQIRAQFTPHFLLNTLSAISGLVTEDPRAARRLLASLGDLLRESLGNGDEIQTLERQLQWLRGYAQILETRHAGQLAFRWDVEDRTLRAMLPRWILQPLVENAVKHGALKRRHGGTVTVSAKVVEDRLVCTVEDNGPGIVDPPKPSRGVGLVLVRRRLALKYADAASLRLKSSGSSTCSIVEVPYAE